MTVCFQNKFLFWSVQVCFNFSPFIQTFLIHPHSCFWSVFTLKSFMFVTQYKYQWVFDMNTWLHVFLSLVWPCVKQKTKIKSHSYKYDIFYMLQASVRSVSVLCIVPQLLIFQGSRAMKCLQSQYCSPNRGETHHQYKRGKPIKACHYSDTDYSVSNVKTPQAPFVHIKMRSGMKSINNTMNEETESELGWQMYCQLVTCCFWSEVQVNAFDLIDLINCNYCFVW